MVQASHSMNSQVLLAPGFCTKDTSPQTLPKSSILPDRGKSSFPDPRAPSQLPFLSPQLINPPPVWVRPDRDPGSAVLGFPPTLLSGLEPHEEGSGKEAGRGRKRDRQGLPLGTAHQSRVRPWGYGWHLEKLMCQELFCLFYGVSGSVQVEIYF